MSIDIVNNLQNGWLYGINSFVEKGILRQKGGEMLAKII